MKRLLLIVSLSALLAGCQAPSAGKAWVRSEVFFGLSKPDGSFVTGQEWQAFLDEVVTPGFPEGLSIVEANGQWRDASGRVIHETSKLLVLLHPRGTAAQIRIDKIRSEYCRRFHQEAVMKVVSQARVTF